MSLRTIMIFPEFENMEIIDHIRKQYDPLFDLVKPHITVIFPFESLMSNELLSEILNIRLKDVMPFELELGGITKQIDSFGNYLFLNVLQGLDNIVYIHDVLYGNEFRKFDMGLPYIPHVTLGKLPSYDLLNKAFDDVKCIDKTFRTIVDKIYVEMIGENEESIIVIEKELCI